jgi:hypothetical protein
MNQILVNKYQQLTAAGKTAQAAMAAITKIIGADKVTAVPSTHWPEIRRRVEALTPEQV